MQRLLDHIYLLVTFIILCFLSPNIYFLWSYPLYISMILHVFLICVYMCVCVYV